MSQEGSFLHRVSNLLQEYKQSYEQDKEVLKHRLANVDKERQQALQQYREKRQQQKRKLEEGILSLSQQQLKRTKRETKKYVAVVYRHMLNAKHTHTWYIPSSFVQELRMPVDDDQKYVSLFRQDLKHALDKPSFTQVQTLFAVRGIPSVYGGPYVVMHTFRDRPTFWKPTFHPDQLLSYHEIESHRLVDKQDSPIWNRIRDGTYPLSFSYEKKDDSKLSSRAFEVSPHDEEDVRKQTEKESASEEDSEEEEEEEEVFRCNSDPYLFVVEIGHPDCKLIPWLHTSKRMRIGFLPLRLYSNARREFPFLSSEKGYTFGKVLLPGVMVNDLMRDSEMCGVVYSSFDEFQTAVRSNLDMEDMLSYSHHQGMLLF